MFLYVGYYEGVVFTEFRSAKKKVGNIYKYLTFYSFLPKLWQQYKEAGGFIPRSSLDDPW